MPNRGDRTAGRTTVARHAGLPGRHGDVAGDAGALVLSSGLTKPASMVQLAMALKDVL